MISTHKLRILRLHGSRTNVKVMQDQTRALCRVMAPYAEFVFATAPFEVRGPSDEIIERLYQDHAPFYEWGHINKLEPEGSDNGWYHQYVGFDRVVEHIDKQIQDHGPFDAVIGFSQGAQRALCLICSGTRVRDVGLRPLFEHPDGRPNRVPIPSIHLIGKKDQHYNTCREHADLYADDAPGSTLSKFVFEHEGGHRFPSEARHPKLYGKISDMIRKHCEQ
ncbi:hypothetical protein PHYSODRAFT_310097 [Phytophthora sojae]|uniref:Serine hydrolase domain-containing protein n=1 Tax=Phytophthora sojae (strain P6497) TaxID=1094619 RepID=G4YL74_PHYSP|nr:hypothetical protein PHYSODRAFT_310097 [Phytophthora sojae]EGZ29989.1 hypothetical protein PHYSODRAFT_310097 [Phytophthora sojae]|eukprot:XP_009517264.1 hypothetical protein PHYSODRAFT_310097 [Phytophthora sojae]